MDVFVAHNPKSMRPSKPFPPVANEGKGEPRPRHVSLILAMALVLTIATTKAPAQEARSVAAKAANKEPLARHVPLRDLLFYLEFDGLDAHADAWRGSAAYKVLSDTKLGAVLEDLVLQGIELRQETVPRDQRVTGHEVVGLLKQVARDGFVIGVSRKAPDDLRIVAVMRNGDRPAAKRLLDLAGTALGRGGVDENAGPATIQKAGRTLQRLGSSGVWLIEKGDLVLTVMSNVDDVLAVLNGQQPGADKHPLRAELAKADEGFTPAAFGFIDMAALPADEVGLGLDGLKRVELRWGFQDDALLTKARVVAPLPRRGLLALLDQPTFGIKTLPPLPPGLTALSVISVDVAKVYDQLNALFKREYPWPPTDSPGAFVLARHGIDLRTELLAHIGPKLAFYAQAPSIEDAATPASLLMSHVAGLTLAAQVRDQAATAAAIDSLIKSFNPILREQLRAFPRLRVTPGLAFLKFAKAPGSRPLYVLDLPPDALSRPYVTMLRPTVGLGGDRLVVSGSKLAADQAMADGPHWRPAGAFVPVVDRLPAEMVYLSLIDPRAGTGVFARMLPVLVRQINAEIAISQRSAGKAPASESLRLDPDMVPSADELNPLLFPSSTTLVVDQEGAAFTHREAIPTLTSPIVWGGVAAYFVPAIQSSREAMLRDRCGANIKQIALALHNYREATNNKFPRPANFDSSGKPRLSWRVAILPFLEQQELYDRFKQDEPWDSPRNKSLLKEMPAAFACPGRTSAEPFTTTYRVIVGKGAMFDKDRDIGLADVTDGKSGTIMVIEAREAVPWTKPDDLPFDPAADPSLQGAGSPHRDGFHAAMADGAVRFLKNTIDLNVFRALITRAGGEVVGAGAF